jgi:hypothetical protein
MQAKFCAALILSGAAAAVHAAPPLEAFAAAEEMKDAVISPDGRYLAAISTVDGIRMVVVRDVKNNGKFAPVMSGDDKGDFDVTWCRFANSTRLFCGLNGTAQLRTFIIQSSKVSYGLSSSRVRRSPRSMSGERTSRRC